MMRLVGRKTLLEPVTDEQVAYTIGDVLRDIARAAEHKTPRDLIDWRTLRVQVEPGRIFGEDYLEDCLDIYVTVESPA